jgi:hypothetical protein
MVAPIKAITEPSLPVVGRLLDDVAELVAEAAPVELVLVDVAESVPEELELALLDALLLSLGAGVSALLLGVSVWVEEVPVVATFGFFLSVCRILR